MFYEFTLYMYKVVVYKCNVFLQFPSSCTH